MLCKGKGLKKRKSLPGKDQRGSAGAYDREARGLERVVGKLATVGKGSAHDAIVAQEP